MKVAVVGAGAVGGWYGGLLVRAGHEVHLVSRRDHAVLRASGLILRGPTGEVNVRPSGAWADISMIGPCDLVVIAAKATANPELPAQVRPLVGPDTIVLTLQNGMGNVEVFAGVVPAERLVAGLCFVCINRLAPAVVENTHQGYVRVAAASGPVNPAVTKVVEVFVAAGVDCRPEASLEAVLWKKLCWNIPFNGLAVAAGGITTEAIMALPSLQARALLLMREVQAAALARGHGFDDAHIRTQFEVTARMGAYRPSSMIDYVEGREVEVEGIWAEPLRRGLAAGVAMPALTELLQDVRQRLVARAG